jgi:hypothetical protein
MIETDPILIRIHNSGYILAFSMKLELLFFLAVHLVRDMYPAEDGRYVGWKPPPRKKKRN